MVTFNFNFLSSDGDELNSLKIKCVQWFQSFNQPPNLKQTLIRGGSENNINSNQ